jgi:tetratricopeptide (TPR) repeat protein
VLAVVVVGALRAAPAAAQTSTAPLAPDAIDLTNLSTKQVGPDGPNATMRFDATLKYELKSAETGSISLFLFENDDESSFEKRSEEAIPVKLGTGTIEATIDYTPHDGVRTLSLVAGLFHDQQHLLTWVSTTPIPLAPWPGRADFEKAMSERLNNDLAAAEQDLTAAIAAAPDTGNYYYWRGDTRVRLQRFDDAIADFSKSIELLPNDRASRVGRGVAELWSGDPNSAITDLSWAIDKSDKPDTITAWAHRARGVAEASLNQPPEAIADYQAYLALEPNATDRSQVEGWINDLS